MDRIRYLRSLQLQNLKIQNGPLESIECLRDQLDINNEASQILRRADQLMQKPSWPGEVHKITGSGIFLEVLLHHHGTTAGEETIQCELIDQYYRLYEDAVNRIYPICDLPVLNTYVESFKEHSTALVFDLSQLQNSIGNVIVLFVLGLGKLAQNVYLTSRKPINYQLTYYQLACDMLRHHRNDHVEFVQAQILAALHCVHFGDVQKYRSHLNIASAACSLIQPQKHSENDSLVNLNLLCMRLQSDIVWLVPHVQILAPNLQRDMVISSEETYEISLQKVISQGSVHTFHVLNNPDLYNRTTESLLPEQLEYINNILAISTNKQMVGDISAAYLLLGQFERHTIKEVTYSNSPSSISKTTIEAATRSLTVLYKGIMASTVNQYLPNVFRAFHHLQNVFILFKAFENRNFRWPADIDMLGAILQVETLIKSFKVENGIKKKCLAMLSLMQRTVHEFDKVTR